jgi:hypothetical protein
MIDIFQQILLSITTLAFGILISSPFKIKCVYLRYSTSWFLGWLGIWFSYFFLIIIDIQITLLSIIVSSTGIVFLVLIANLKSIRQFDKAALIRNILFFVTFGSLIAIVVLIDPYFSFTPDSIQTQALSRIVHKVGFFKTTNFEMSEILFSARLPLFITIQNFAYLLEIDVYYAFPRISLFLLIIGMYGVWRFLVRGNKYLILFLSTVFLLFSSNIVIYHTFYLHYNLLTMTYFNLGLFWLIIYIHDRKQRSLIIATILIAATNILRVEMMLFSLIPFLYLSWTGSLKVGIGKYYSFFIYLFISYSWTLWRVFKYPLDETIFPITSERGGLFIVATTVFLFCLVYFSPLNNFKKKLAINFLLGGEIVLFIGWYLFIPGIRSAASRLTSLLIRNIGGWGYTWHLLIVVVTIFSIFRFTNSVTKNKYISVFETKVLDYMIFTIVTFFVAWILMFSLFPYAINTDQNFWDAGNRIVLYIYPLCLFFIGYFVYLIDIKRIRHNNI